MNRMCIVHGSEAVLVETPANLVPMKARLLIPRSQFAHYVLT